MGSWATSLFPCQRSSVVLSNKLRAMYPFLPRELANKVLVFLSEQRAALKVSHHLMFSQKFKSKYITSQNHFLLEYGVLYILITIFMI